jgi:tRNA 2-thiouridine synthesizing protein A
MPRLQRSPALFWGGWLDQDEGQGQDELMSETLLDLRDLVCPLPVLRANRTLRGMPAGERLRVLATDAASVNDFKLYCRETGHALLSWSDEGGVYSFTIRRRQGD